ncbi:hypothetical protein A2U01_0102686, partial [Trifolium medium]|nr:hypothetical protein [Trifolium medium]
NNSESTIPWNDGKNEFRNGGHASGILRFCDGKGIVTIVIKCDGKVILRLTVEVIAKSLEKVGGGDSEEFRKG